MQRSKIIIQMGMLIKFSLAVLVLVLVPLSAGASEKRYDVPIGDSPSWGPENAPVTIIEFLDYQ